MQAIIWSKPGCGYCNAAKSLLKNKDIEFEERVIGHEWTKEQLIEAAPNARTVPQIFLDGELIGGFNELRARLS